MEILSHGTVIVVLPDHHTLFVFLEFLLNDILSSDVLNSDLEIIYGAHDPVLGVAIFKISSVRELGVYVRIRLNLRFPITFFDFVLAHHFILF